MPVAKRPPLTGMGSEPPVTRNTAPTVMPGDGSDVDPRQRVENVGEQVPVIELDVTGADPNAAVDAAGLSARFLVPESPSTVAPGQLRGWVPPVAAPNGVVHDFQPDGAPYLVTSRPWCLIALPEPEGYVVTGLFCDTVMLRPETAARYVGLGALAAL